MIESESCHVDLAYSGPEALAIFLDVRPDLIFTDVDMPGFDGFELARRIRIHEATRPGRAAWIFSISARDGRKARQDSHLSGCEGHYVNPLRLKDMTDVIAALQNRIQADDMASPGPW